MLEEKSYGIILVRRIEGQEDRYLILKQNTNTQHWSYPKGHAEGDEGKKETALRELEEETGITDIEFVNVPSLFENYQHEKDGKVYNKTNEFFIAFTDSDKVTIQAEEVLEYKWATYDEAMQTFTYEEPKKLLKNVREYLDPNGLGKDLGVLNEFNLTESDIKNFKYRYVARAVVVTPENEIVTVSTTEWGTYLIPGGGIEGMETILEATIREVKEETGYDVEVIRPLGNLSVYVPDNDSHKGRISKTFTYLMRAVGEKGETMYTEDELSFDYAVSTHPYGEAYELLKNDAMKLGLNSHANRSFIFFEEAKKYINDIK